MMANLEIAERSVPQHGRIDLNVGGNPVGMRVSVLPTRFGESVAIRVLDRATVGFDLNRLGMDSQILQQFRELIHGPNGLILITGPTGAGKTMTLYAALDELNETTGKIITAEDPVEYRLGRVNQVQVNTKIGLTFASILRTALRHDPDVVLVVEMRRRRSRRTGRCASR